MRAAFFDFDRTLIMLNSAFPWLMSEWRAGLITSSQVLEGLYWLLQYKLGKASMDAAMRKGVGLLKGQREADLRERTRIFYQSTLRHRYRPGAQAALKWHRESGDRLVLLTTVSSYLAECIAEDLHFHDILCTRFDVDHDGLFTGQSNAFAYGRGKLVLAQKWCDENKVSPSACAFYTDSFTDWPVLDWVGRPVAVNPDFRLKRLSKKRGWEIVDWGASVKA